MALKHWLIRTAKVDIQSFWSMSDQENVGLKDNDVIRIPW
jgi:hypothetical protein